MEKEQLGLHENIECRFVKTEPEIIEKITKERSMSIEKVRKCMRYNIFTIQQYVDLSGMALSTIHNHCRPSIIFGEVGTKLDFCYPFPDSEGSGPKFILRNEKSEKYLKHDI